MSPLSRIDQPFSLPTSLGDDPIMRPPVHMRKTIVTHAALLRRVEGREAEYDQSLRVVFETL